MNASDSGKAPSTTGPFEEAALARLREWDPAWAEVCARMAAGPWHRGVLPRRLAELVSVAVSAAATNLNADGTRRHIRGALEAGATRDEVLMVLKMASLMTLHSCSLGAPILLEEAKAAGARAQPQAGPTPACDQIKALGQWNSAWDPFLALDPAFTDAFMAAGAGVYATGVLPPKEVELLSIAFDASFTHMYAPGTRRHIHNALAAGATVDEIMAVLELCVVQGVQALNLGVPILAEELERHAAAGNAS